MSTTSLKTTFVVLSVATFAASLATVAVYDGFNKVAPLYGYHLLIFGWIGVFGRGYAWLANTLLFATWPLMFIARFHRLALWTGALALLLAVSFFPFTRMTRNSYDGAHPLHPFGPGYFLWTTSIGLALAGCVVRKSPVEQ